VTRARLALFLACAILIFLASYTLYSFTNTLRQLDLIESQRDQWQRPSDVLRALDLRDGSTVVDLGSGAGYFTLKLSPAVGKRGRVLAVDLRRLSLFFLWTRARLLGQHNVQAIAGTADDPRLPAGAVDAVLICNTYHEFTNAPAMLDHAFRSLRPGGRVVVLDRAPHETDADRAHAARLSFVEDQFRRQGFQIVSHDGHFIDRPGDDSWWLLIGQKPSSP
jgi:ubiquinone/menaquinone biosynthesis C-methylase UbiE